MSDVMERFAAIPTATVCDAYIKLGIRPVDRMVVRGVAPLGDYRTTVVGRARTQQMVVVRNPGEGSVAADRLLHFRIADEASAGDFLVIAIAGRSGLASFGDVLALKAKHMGVTGVVLDGPTRDAAIIRDIELPLWAAGITPIPQGFGGYSVASVNEPVTCGGVDVRPGDYVIADADGVVIVPVDEADQILATCEELEHAEDAARAGVLAGTPLSEIYPSRNYYADNAKKGTKSSS